jgi:NDP-sugar pyrophosphorylase family protein
MKVIILAGGKGTRLSESTKLVPKPLVDVGRRELLLHQIELLNQHGLNDIRFSLGHRAEQIISWLGNKYEYVVEKEPLGTGGAVKFASKDLNEPFIVTNGDIIANINIEGLIQRHQETGKQVIVVREVADARDFGLIELDPDGHISSFKEKPAEPVTGHINAGFYVLQPHGIQQFPVEKFSIERDYFPAAAASGFLTAHIHDGFWFDCGTEERLRQVREFFQFRPAP